jgi:hypothetical protein
MIEHYSVTLGAILVKNQRMFILIKQFVMLINKHFKDEDKLQGFINVFLKTVIAQFMP